MLVVDILQIEAHCCTIILLTFITTLFIVATIHSKSTNIIKRFGLIINYIVVLKLNIFIGFQSTIKKPKKIKINFYFILKLKIYEDNFHINFI
jgi:hypothetical protein